MVLRKTQQSRQYFNSTHKRGSNGRFIKKEQFKPKIEYYTGSNIPEYTYNNEGQREKIMYRAVVTLNGVPIHSDKARGRSRYKSFSWAKIDYYENINISEMKKHLLEEIANHFHCKVYELWFNPYDNDNCEWGDIEYPKPYHGEKFEGLEVGEY